MRHRAGFSARPKKSLLSKRPVSELGRPNAEANASPLKTARYGDLTGMNPISENIRRSRKNIRYLTK